MRVISTGVVEGAKRRDHAAEKSCDDCSTSYLTTIRIRCVGQQSLISYVVKRMVYRESQDFSAPSLNICCGSFGALQIPKDSGRNDKRFGLMAIFPISIFYIIVLIRNFTSEFFK